MSDETENEIEVEPRVISTAVSRIDGPYRAAPLTGATGDITELSWDQLYERAKVHTLMGILLPPHVRNNAPLMLGFIIMARRWKMPDELFVAQNSYVVRNQAGVETVAYAAAVYHAALKAAGAIIGRAHYSYDGEGDELRCTVSVIDAETGERQSLQTAPLRLCRKHSPLWKENPSQQLGYYAMRNLVRLKYPDVLAGLYTRDEFDVPSVETPPSPNLMARLPGRIEGEGFEVDTVEQQRQEEAAIAVVREKAEAKAAKDRERKKVYKGAAAARKAEKEAEEAAPEATHDPAPSPADDPAHPTG
jgi:hypothetical protein